MQLSFGAYAGPRPARVPLGNPCERGCEPGRHPRVPEIFRESAPARQAESPGDTDG